MSAAAPSSSSARPAASRSSEGKGALPEWGVERVLKRLGRGPAALARRLDRVEKIAGVGRVLRFFSSVWVGISILFLLGCYIGVGSGLPGFRAWMEMTDLQFFDAWPMRVLLVGLGLNIVLVTVRKIPLTVFKLGPWIVHVGILTLVTGAVVYFSGKVEGSIRLFLGKPTKVFYDATERALYAFRVDGEGKPVGEMGMAAMPTLPIFNEHLAGDGKGLSIPVEGGKFGVAGMEKVGVTVTGYYPAAALETSWEAGDGIAGGEVDRNPAVRVSMALGGVSGGNWLVGKRAADRVLDGVGAPFGVEYLYRPEAGRVRELETGFKGVAGIVVRVPKLGVERSYTVEAGQVVAVEGTPYVLTVGEQTTMPLISKGYEGAMSNALTVGVERKASSLGEAMAFNRMALFRYPERSPDFVKGADGKMKRVQDRVDHEIEIGFADCSKDQFWVVEGDGGKMRLIHRMGGGAVETSGIGMNAPVQVKVGQVGMTVTVLERTGNAIGVPTPRVIPAEFRERGQTAMDAMQESVIEMKLEAGGVVKEHVYVPFTQFAEVGVPPAGRPATVVNIPGVGAVGFVMSTVRREMPSEVVLSGFEAVKYAGASNSYADFVSTLGVKDLKGGGEQTMVAHLNAPAEDQGVYYFQSAWDGDDHATAEKRFSVIGVANRPGIRVMIVGAILMVMGIGYAFYVKPVLLNVKKRQLAAWAAAERRGNGN